MPEECIIIIEMERHRKKLDMPEECIGNHWITIYLVLYCRDFGCWVPYLPYSFGLKRFTFPHCKSIQNLLAKLDCLLALCPIQNFLCSCMYNIWSNMYCVSTEFQYIMTFYSKQMNFLSWIFPLRVSLLVYSLHAARTDESSCNSQMHFRAIII